MDGRRREQLITLIMALGITAVFAAIMLLPGTSRLSRLRSENRILLQEQQRFAEDYGHLAPALAAEITRLESQVAEAIRRVPPADIRVDFEQDLRALGETLELVGEDFFRTTTFQRDRSISVRGATLRFKASFMKLYEFLKELEGQERLTVVQGLELQPVPGPDARFDITLELKFFYGEL
jgi:hypothetical protein